MREVILRFAPAPMMRMGVRAASSACTAARTAFSSGTGRRLTLRGMGPPLASSSAMSSGNSRCTAPGFSSSARRKASRTREAMLSAEASWWV